MEYVYSALLLHSAKQPINEENIKKVLQGAGIQPDDAKIKALVASMEGVNIDEAIKQSAIAVAAPAAEAKKEEEPEEDKSKKAEEAAAGLGALFGQKFKKKKCLNTYNAYEWRRNKSEVSSSELE